MVEVWPSGVGCHTVVVGLDPTRHHRRSHLDYVFVVGATVAAIGLVAWAVFG